MYYTTEELPHPLGMPPIQAPAPITRGGPMQLVIRYGVLMCRLMIICRSARLDVEARLQIAVAVHQVRLTGCNMHRFGDLQLQQGMHVPCTLVSILFRSSWSHACKLCAVICAYTHKVWFCQQDTKFVEHNCSFSDLACKSDWVTCCCLWCTYTPAAVCGVYIRL